jgi:putative transposase
LAIKVAASTVWEILPKHGAAPPPQRQSTTWPDSPHSQADALLACDFFQTRTLTGASLYIFAVIEHATRRIPILGATAPPTAAWVVQLGRNLAMNLEDVDNRARFLVRDRDSKFTQAFNAVLADAGPRVINSGVRIPRMNSIMQRRIQTCQRELPDRTLIRDQHHLLHPLRDFEPPYHEHRPHRALDQTAPLRPLPEPITEPGQILHLDIHRRDRLGGTLHEIPTRCLSKADD